MEPGGREMPGSFLAMKLFLALAAFGRYAKVGGFGELSVFWEWTPCSVFRETDIAARLWQCFFIFRPSTLVAAEY